MATYNEEVIINDNLQVNGSSDEVQVAVKAASTQTEALQQWQDNSGSMLSEINEEGHLHVGDLDATIDALIESHNLDDSSKPARGFHAKGSLTGALSSLVSWVVQELVLKGTGGISALHRALRVQATNENTGAMASGADVRGGDFEVINTGGNSETNNLEMSALVAKVDNQTGAYVDKVYGLKVEIVDDGDSNEVYAIHTDTGIVHLGDVLELTELSPTGNPSSGNAWIYPKSDGNIYARYPSGIEQNLSSGGTVSSTIATAGESLSERSLVFLDESNEKWYKIDIDATPVKCGRLVGIVTESGGIVADQDGEIHLFGLVDGFSSLTPNAPIYASTTAGGYTQTKPTPSLGGSQIALLQIGYATSNTEIFVAPKQVIYLRTSTLADEATLTVEHHPDTESFERHVSVYLAGADAGNSLESYASSNQDTDIAFKDQTPVTYTADQCTGGTATASTNFDGARDKDEAFDNQPGASGSNRWVSGNSVNLPHWIEYDFGTDKTIRRYTMENDYNSGSYRPPTTWELQYFDGANWQTADSRTTYTDWTGTETFDVAGVYTSSRWRIYVTANIAGQQGTSIGEIEMMEAATYTNGPDKLAQGFQLSSADDVGSIKLWLKKVGSPTGNLTVKVETDNSGDPSGTPLTNGTSNTVAASTLSTSYGWVEFTFATPPTLSDSTQYHIVLETTDSASETDYVVWGADSSTPGYSDGDGKSESSSVWSAESVDFIFDMFAPGVPFINWAPLAPWDSSLEAVLNRLDDGSGSDSATKTTIKNNLGSSKEVTLMVTCPLGN